ncbi:hypothetical protein SME22J_06510 [Serratia marcescens]|nr:hypothetical protein SME22J_06510 [Serratia marcescens]BEO41280.1 hypothetical protein SMQE13_06310 [Serratia marcescens]
MTDYITRAFAKTQLAVYQKYLSAEEYAYVRQHCFTRLQEWPALIAQYHQAMNDGVAAGWNCSNLTPAVTQRRR